MRLEDQLDFAIYEAVAINRIGYDEYYKNVNLLVQTKLHINEAYMLGEIDYNEFNKLMYEYTKEEHANIVGHKLVRMGADFYHSISEEFDKMVNSWKKKGFCGKASAVGRVIGITLATGVRVAGALAVGPVDWALNAAAALITIPATDFDISILTPLYKTTTKPFIDEIKNHHANKCESLHATAKKLKNDGLELRQKVTNNEITAAELERSINKLMKNILSLAKDIDKEHAAIQKDIDKTAERMERIKKQRGGVTDGSQEYHSLKHKLENLKKAHDSLGKPSEYKYSKDNKTEIHDDAVGAKAEALLTKYAQKYRNNHQISIHERPDGTFSKSDARLILREMIKDNVPKNDLKAVKEYLKK